VIKVAPQKWEENRCRERMYVSLCGATTPPPTTYMSLALARATIPAKSLKNDKIFFSFVKFPKIILSYHKFEINVRYNINL
jgi:hypothetical protein